MQNASLHCPSNRPLLQRVASRLPPFLHRPAVAFGRAIGHLPVDLDLQHRIVWFLRNEFERPRRSFEIDFYGYRYPGDGEDLIDMLVYYFGAFEWPVVMLLRDLARALTTTAGKPVCYDIGANTGQHSLFIARHVGRVYAFEPYGPVREKLERRVRLNRLDHVEVLPTALGDVEGEAYYYPPRTTNGGTGSFLAQTNHENSRSSIRLPVAQGDRLVAVRGLLPPDLMKIDVEGFEKLVLQGLAETLRRHRPIIVAELSKASRWLFGNEAGLRTRLYDDCLLFEVANRRIPRGYRLRPFDFARSGQFLCVPRERVPLLARVRIPAADGSS
jgi:FkbM family methyltransferase